MYSWVLAMRSGLRRVREGQVCLGAPVVAMQGALEELLL